MDLELRGKRVLITGASKGIGRAVAEVLAEHGCSLALASRSPEELQAMADDLAREHPDLEVRVHPANLARTEEQDTLSGACSDVDILVNNAGAIPAGSIERTSARRGLAQGLGSQGVRLR